MLPVEELAARPNACVEREFFNLEPPQYRRVCDKPFRAGVTIGPSEEEDLGLKTGNCTAAFKATGNVYGNRFVLTAGHCYGGRSGSVVAIGPAGLWPRRDPWRCVMQLRSQHKLGRAFAPLTPHLMRNSVGRTMLMRGTVAKPRQMPPEVAIEMAETFARTPCFDEHLSETRRERFRDGQAIDVPVTIAWGEKDRLIPRKARKTDELPSQTEVVTLSGCGHSPMWDDPELVAETILKGGRKRGTKQVAA